MVVRKPGESLDSLIHRFNSKVNSSGVLSEYKKHSEYRSPSQKKREKRAKAQKKNAAQAQRR